MAINTIFCFSGNGTVRNNGMGITKMATSVTRLIEDPMSHQSRRAMHRPGTVRSQRLRRGIQARHIDTTCEIPKAMMKRRKTSQSFWKAGNGNTRRYCSRNAALIKGNAFLGMSAPVV